MAMVFHRFQKETPNTWRPEGPASYASASLLRFAAALGIACLFTLVTRFHVGSFDSGIGGSVRFALCIWAAIALPIILESAVFIRLHRFVVIGQLLDWLTTALVTSGATSWWLGR
jgi:hypothetical protein